MKKTENVAIIGASEKEGRYSRMAQELLLEYGHTVFPIAPKKETVLGVKCVDGIEKISETIDTFTVYVRPSFLEAHVDAIISKKAKRVILNPGTESESIQQRLEDAGIEVINGCTLVMLKSSQF